MPNSVPNKFICECEQILINHYPSQIINHRNTKKHALRLINIIKEKEKEEINKIKNQNKKESLTLIFE